MKTFGWTERFCRSGIPGGRAWVWYFWAIEYEATALGSMYERVGKGYIAQETDRLFAEGKKAVGL